MGTFVPSERSLPAPPNKTLLYQFMPCYGYTMSTPFYLKLVQLSYLLNVKSERVWGCALKYLSIIVRHVRFKNVTSPRLFEVGVQICENKNKQPKLIKYVKLWKQCAKAPPPLPRGHRGGCYLLSQLRNTRREKRSDGTKVNRQNSIKRRFMAPFGSVFGVQHGLSQTHSLTTYVR